MFKIKAEQLEVLSDSAFGQFLDHAAETLAFHFPAHAERLGKEKLRSAAYHYVRQGEELGFESSRDLILWSDLCVMLGDAFAQDRTLGWAAHILQDQELYETPTAQIDALWYRAGEHLDAVFAGEDAVEPLDAYQTCLTMFADDTAAPVSPAGMIADLTRLWPQRVAVTDAGALTAFIQTAVQRASELGFGDADHQRDFARLSFLLGHAFDADPFYPWARDAFDIDDLDAVMDGMKQGFAGMVRHV